MNSIALEERRNVINEKLAKKDRKKKKKKKEKKEKGSKETTGSDSNSTGPSNCCADMAEHESTQSFIENELSLAPSHNAIFRFILLRDMLIFSEKKIKNYRVALNLYKLKLNLYKL